MLTFDEAYADAKGHGPVSILLGNGFSIACNNRFNYRRLVDEAPVRASRCGTAGSSESLTRSA